MSTIEKLFVQIFERKRWITEHLKQQKLLYDQHLASKLLIQGIIPPPWLLNPQFPSSTSDPTAINKEELISGLLLPQPGPLVTYPSGACFGYDKSVATAVNDGLIHVTCAKTCASSNDSEGDKPDIIPSFHINDNEDGSGIVPQCHVDGTEDKPSYVPMSPEDQTDTMNSNMYLKLEESLARMQRSRSRQKALELRNSAKTSRKCCLGKEINAGISSGNQTLGYDQPLEVARRSVELIGPSALSNCINEEAAPGYCSNKEMRSDACSDSPSQSRAKAVQNEDGKKKVVRSTDYVGTKTGSGSSCPQPIIGGHQNSKKSNEVYSGRMTRSRSGKVLLLENDDPQNGRVTRSHSNQMQPIIGNHAIGNSKDDSGRIAKSRCGGAKEAETKDRRSRSKNETSDYRTRAKTEMSVKPKQLDFDDIEEPYLADSLAEGKGNFKEKTRDLNIEERCASLPCSRPAKGTSQKRTPLACESQEVYHSFPISNKIPERTSLLLDRPPDSTEGQMRGITVECDADHRLPGPSVEISISQKGKLESEAKQELDKGRSDVSLPNADTEATVYLHRDAVEATLSPEKTRHELSFCSDRKETSHLCLPDADTEATMSVHPVVATLTLKKARHELAYCNDRKETNYFCLPNADIEAAVSLPRDVEATLSSQKARCNSSSHNDCKETSCLTFHSADSAATMCLHRDVVEATWSSEKTRHELSSGNNCKETSHFSMSNADTKTRVSLNRDAVKATSSAEKSRHAVTSHDGFKALLETQAIELVPPSPGRNSAGSLASTLKFHPVFIPNETRSNHAFEMLKLGSCFRNAATQISCFSSEAEFVGCSKFPDVQAGIGVLPQYNVSNAMDGSWPCYKRRKIGYQVHYKSASPRVRVNTYPDANENIPNKSLNGEEDNSSCLPQQLTISDGSDVILSSSESVARAAYGLKYLGSKEPELTPKVQYEEGKSSTGKIVMMPFTCEQKVRPTCRGSNVTQDFCHHQEQDSNYTDYFPMQEAREAPTSTVHRTRRLSNDLKIAEVGGQRTSTDKLTFVQTTLDKRESLLGADKLKFSIGLPLIERMDVYDADADEIVPEFEGFILAEKSESVHNTEYEFLNGEIPLVSEKAEFTNLPEQIPGPVSLSTPASPFPTAYKMHFTPCVYRSVPNGLIENIDLTSDIVSSDNAQGKSYSDYCSFPVKRLARDISIPFVSPVGKGFEGITTKSGSSDQRLSGYPELICFPIQEDPEASEEGVNVDDTYDTGMKGSAGNSSIREPLRDITSINESILAPGHAVERGSLESVTAEVSISEKHNKDSKKNEMHLRSRQARQGKENQSVSVGAHSIKKHSESLTSRYSKPKLSEKSSLRSRGQSLSEKESKRNNIVSNVKSFLPLIQQKQASSVVPAKREVKIKALEAAEAAKRVAEKRENERKQKKEALKLERARLEQENLKQMELKKKLQEEEKKKREAENAARKRQREEEERKEKGRKRKRIEEARCQQKQAAEKISAWREDLKCEIKDGRTHERKTSNDEADRAAEGVNMSINPDEPVGGDGRKADNSLPSTNDNKSSTGSSDTAKVGSIDVADISTPNCDKSDKLISQTSQEQSYDISPYQCSDDEEEEEDDVPNRKFIPTWASSKSCVAVALSSLKHLDPDTIFPPGSFCNLEEVLLPRRLAQN